MPQLPCFSLILGLVWSVRCRCRCRTNGKVGQSQWKLGVTGTLGKQGVSHQLGTTPNIRWMPARSHSTSSSLDDARCEGSATL
ncbi:hypothetical protein F4811DRAFT_487785 [Daldinia bambusicola]|nr:hypothetical protein F4811DRAFT_487785 [Daldinia bambusicola]